MIRAVAISACLAAPVTAQEAAFVPDDPALFETFRARMTVCVDFAVTRDPSVIDAADTGVLGETEQPPEPLDEGKFERVFLRTRDNGKEGRTVTFYAGPQTYKTAIAGCHLPVLQLSDRDALGLLYYAAQKLRARLPLAGPRIEEGSVGRYDFCSGTGVRVQLLITAWRKRQVAALTFDHVPVATTTDEDGTEVVDSPCLSEAEG